MTDRDEGKVQIIQRQVDRVLDSSGFAASHRLRDFLRFVCLAALEVREELAQVEIARAVLGLGDDFNPTEDTSVRKLATMVRHRLESYYNEQGKLDPVLILLPPRSYIPRFRFSAEEKLSPPGRRSLRSRKLGIAVATGVAIVVLFGLSAFFMGFGKKLSSIEHQPGRFSLAARKGSIIYGGTDAPPESLLLGPLIEPTDQLVARMVFSPKTQYDQAGIMVFEDVNNYVRLARHLRRRNSFLFTAEIKGVRSVEPETFADDPMGQTGEPVWLAIRRNGQEFHAFSSTDGWNWSEFGHVVSAPLAPTKARAAIYAFSDTSTEPPPVALFDHVSIGPPLATWGCPATPVSSLQGWHVTSRCGNEAEAGDWSLTGLVDNCAWSRTNAGLIVIGDRGLVSALRNEWQGGSIVVSTGPMRLFRRPDLVGNPPLVMRIRREAGSIQAEAAPA